MRLQELCAKYPVLSLDELLRNLDDGYSSKKRSRESLLAYHLREGHFVRIRRGLFAVVPPGFTPEDCPIDPYLIAAKSADDAVLAYHTALEVHSKAHSVFGRFFFLSNGSLRPTQFRGYTFQCVQFQKSLRVKGKQEFATTMVNRGGLSIRVTSLERTMVDLLDRPDLGGGWEEVWRSLGSVEYYDVDLVTSYVALLNKKTIAAKVGYFLQQHSEQLMIEDRSLDFLRKMRPKQPHYMQRGEGGKLVSEWNLIVPFSLVSRTWEESI